MGFFLCKLLVVAICVLDEMPDKRRQDLLGFGGRETGQEKPRLIKADPLQPISDPTEK